MRDGLLGSGAAAGELRAAGPGAVGAVGLSVPWGCRCRGAVSAVGLSARWGCRCRGAVGAVGLSVPWGCRYRGAVGAVGLSVPWGCRRDGTVGAVGLSARWGCRCRGAVGAVGLSVPDHREKVGRISAPYAELSGVLCRSCPSFGDRASRSHSCSNFRTFSVYLLGRGFSVQKKTFGVKSKRNPQWFRSPLQGCFQAVRKLTSITELSSCCTFCPVLYVLVCTDS
ncbi:uncharacterized protein LOC116654329 isoform X1 [Coturnix japonica]|uniref:uncharacterized protein LOC116654329 isoform X1 n=1 Tax=Coturnix japonica TaxID=93934 RepID=UPI0013A5EAD2|nr:uncharacterized protein LOC116654329 isoform X1 [Coturnix japonica]